MQTIKKTLPEDADSCHTLSSKPQDVILSRHLLTDMMHNMGFLSQ